MTSVRSDRTFYVSPRASDNVDGFHIKKPDLPIDLPYIGCVRSRRTDEIESSNWMLGCETLDRDYADYHQYKEYISALGIKVLRMQGGWAKTEKVQGIYDWTWMDNIIHDAVDRGFMPWLQTGYGNPIYPGGGGENLGAGMPLSQEALAAYENWVVALVTRYKEKVKDWEVWNEPNFSDNLVNTPEITADFNIRTATIIKRIQPDARISALALGHIDVEYVERFFAYLSEKKSIELFHNVTYHDYVYNPDANKLAVYKMRQIVEKFAPGMIMRQGENGAPSVGGTGGALSNYNWCEVTQAKWDIRRMLENLGNDIECSIFGIIDMNYSGNGPIRRKNTKGIVESAFDNQAVRPKIAYYAIQHVTSIFDHTLERLKMLKHTYHIAPSGSRSAYSLNTDRSISVYGYRNKDSQKQLYAMWADDAIPRDEHELNCLEFNVENGNFDEPVYVDMITGGVYEIPAEQWRKQGDVYTFKNIPVYDSPILVVDRTLISMK
ncbi:hypothetical protein [Paenibacillus roseipurpureus]|uniref:Beta-xylosidase n=1 Tax=Paenibacillus roseopurpureus TaxID=2918901 RepID=A0AA96LU26_9BACL|nr:hypothetical protein [Paenibacillus sp. MBLB1832]WNR46089.1 hypothetical protein MJB10_08350 [Paenibacillus sp. MBLB1832]